MRIASACRSESLNRFWSCELAVGRILRGANDLDDRVDAVDRDLEAVEDVLALERLVEVELRAPDDDGVPMCDVVLEALLERHHLRHEAARRGVGHQSEHDHTERRLHRGVLVELIEDDARDGVALELDHQPHTVAIRFVSQIADAFQLLVADQVGDADDQPVRVDLIRHFGDDDLRLVRRFLLLDHRARAHHDAPASRLLIILDPRAAVDVRAGREVGALDVLSDVGERRVGIVDQQRDRVDDLAQVVRRNVRRHADGDARRSVDDEVRHARREHRRLFVVVVEVRREVDRRLVDVGDHLERDRHEPRFGVSVRRRRIAVDRSEIPLAVDERIAQREILHHAHERVVHRAVAVRVVLAEHVADDRRRFLVRTSRHEPRVEHRVQHAPVHGLEAIAHVGKRARYDDAHRVIDERLFDLVVDQARKNAFAIVRSGHGKPGGR